MLLYLLLEGVRAGSVLLRAKPATVFFRENADAAGASLRIELARGEAREVDLQLR
jgi:hypothetical protein